MGLLLTSGKGMIAKTIPLPVYDEN